MNSWWLIFFQKLLLCCVYHVCIWVQAHACHCTCLELRGWFSGLGSSGILTRWTILLFPNLFSIFVFVFVHAQVHTYTLCAHAWGQRTPCGSTLFCRLVSSRNWTQAIRLWAIAPNPTIFFKIWLWHMPVIPELWQEDQEFKVVSDFTGSVSPAGLHNTLSPKPNNRENSRDYLGGLTLWPLLHELCFGTVIENSGVSFWGESETHGLPWQNRYRWTVLL